MEPWQKTCGATRAPEISIPLDRYLSLLSNEQYRRGDFPGYIVVTSHEAKAIRACEGWNLFCRIDEAVGEIRVWRVQAWQHEQERRKDVSEKTKERFKKRDKVAKALRQRGITGQKLQALLNLIGDEL